MNKSLYVDIPEELYQVLRKYCFENELDKKQVVIAALNSFLGGKSILPKAIKTKKEVPPIPPTGNKGSMPFI